MSLINDMLRDLDTRRTQASAPQAAALQGLGLSGPLRSASREHLTAMLAIIGLVCAIALVWPLASTHPEHSDRIMITAGRSLPLPLPLPEISTHRRGVSNESRQELPTDNKPDAAAPTPQASGRRQARAAPQAQPADRRSEAAAPAPEPEPPASDRRQARIDPEPAMVPSSSVIQHPQTAEMQLAREYRAAVAKVQAQQYTEAIRRLQQILALDDGHHKARLLLARLQIKLQDHARAETLLADGLARHPGHAPFAKQYARLMIARGRTGTAQLTLETALPEAGNDAEYQALLAGLYQRTGKSAAAASRYQAALQLAPARGDWWMGLGISEEQAGQPRAAQAAYEQALRHPLKANLGDYVKSRLRNLPPAGLP